MSSRRSPQIGRPGWASHWGMPVFPAFDTAPRRQLLGDKMVAQAHVHSKAKADYLPLVHRHSSESSVERWCPDPTYDSRVEQG